MNSCTAHNSSLSPRVQFPTTTNIRPSKPDTHSVVVTGNFDNWSQADGVFAKDADLGVFETTLKVAERQKLVFKFVVNNSEWVTLPDYKIEYDEHGNPNNYVDAAELVAIEEFQRDVTPVPAVVLPVETKASEISKEVLPGTDSEPLELTPDVHDDEERLTNVLTSGSSYAAVSIPESSDFEDVPAPDEEGDDNEPRRRTAPEDDTPTNSLYHSAVLSGSPMGGKQPQDPEVTTLGPSSRNSSFTGKLHHAEGDSSTKLALVNLPGSFPSPKKEAHLTENRGSRRDGLITRVRGLFRS